MSVQLMESLTAVGFGAADAAIAQKVTKRLPGNLPMSVGFEAAGILVGLFGQKLGLGADVRDPVMISALALAGSRAAKLAMAGKLMTPSQWGSVGGEGVDAYAQWAAQYGAAYAAQQGGRAVPQGRNWAPQMRRIGRGGLGTDLYPAGTDIFPGAFEQGGVAS